jgi:hypothetical protein
MSAAREDTFIVSIGNEIFASWQWPLLSLFGIAALPVVKKMSEKWGLLV